MRPAINKQLWLLIPLGFLIGFSLTPPPTPKTTASTQTQPPQKPNPPAPPQEKPALGISKPLSLNAIDVSKRLVTLLKIYNTSSSKVPSTLHSEQERLRLLGELDATNTARILGDLWNLKADPAGPRTVRELGLPTDTLSSAATSSLECLLVERLIDIDRQSAWNLAALRSQTKALALCLKHLHKLLPSNQLLERLLTLRPDIARETHRTYLKESDADGAPIPPLISAESLRSALSRDALLWFQNGPLILLEEIIESSLLRVSRTDLKQTASLFADALEAIRTPPLDADSWESIAHDLLRRLHRITETSHTQLTDQLFDTLIARGLHQLVDDYRSSMERDPEPDTHSPSLRSSGAGAFHALTQPSSPLANNPTALCAWFENLPEGPYREGFLDAALEQAATQVLTHVAAPDLLTLGTPEERVAFFIDWFERNLKSHHQPLETRAALAELQLPPDELASVLNHIAPLRNP